MLCQHLLCKNLPFNCIVEGIGGFVVFVLFFFLFGLVGFFLRC